MIYFPFESNIYYIITLDEEFKIKKTDENGKKCFVSYQLEEYSYKHSSSVTYANNKYIIINSYNYNNTDYFKSKLNGESQKRLIRNYNKEIQIRRRKLKDLENELKGI